VGRFRMRRADDAEKKSGEQDSNHSTLESPGRGMRSHFELDVKT